MVLRIENFTTSLAQHWARDWRALRILFGFVIARGSTAHPTSVVRPPALRRTTLRCKYTNLPAMRARGGESHRRVELAEQELLAWSLAPDAAQALCGSQVRLALDGVHEGRARQHHPRQLALRTAAHTSEADARHGYRHDRRRPRAVCMRMCHVDMDMEMHMCMCMCACACAHVWSCHRVPRTPRGACSGRLGVPCGACPCGGGGEHWGRGGRAFGLGREPALCGGGIGTIGCIE